MGRFRHRPANAGLFSFAPIVLALILLFLGQLARAETSPVKDGTGYPLQMTQPPSRIISLSPAHTDLLHSLGVADRIVGVIGMNPASIDAPSVGTVSGLDYERILVLQPDLILAWDGGTPEPWINRLRSMGLTVYATRTRQLRGIPDTLMALGRILGQQPERLAIQLARQARDKLERLQTLPERASPVPVFYQVWRQPLMTINADHIISDAIQTCGGVNIFAELPALVPQISLESVLARNPSLIVTAVAGADGKQPPDLKTAGLAHWLPLTRIQAVRDKRFLILDADKVTRPTIKMLEAVERLCQAIAHQP